MNELARELNNLQPTRRIKSIQFGLFNPEEIRTSSVCEVTKPDTFDGTEPVINGLFDPRMGVIERGPECATCENNNAMCPGHFGHIELTLPVFHMHFIHIVMKLLPCVCFRCSNLLVKKTNKKLLKDVKGKTGEIRFKEIYKASTKTQKASKCCHNEGCRVIQPAKYTLLTSDKMRGMEKKIPGLEKGTVVAVVAEFKEEAIRDIKIPRKHRITPEQCYEIFRRITDEDCLFLGFNPVFSRPEWMICTVLPVPPPSVRPSVQRDNNQRSEDDLTYVLLSIIKANNQLRKKIDQQEEQRKIDAAYELLQWNVATLISNKIPGIPQNVQRSGKVIKALRERITGKNARIRGNLLGKRVDFSARTVISVDPNISIDEFGMPKKIAMILTYPEIVTEQNFEEMEQIVRNGPSIHPGAKKIERLEFDCFGTPSPCTINLKHVDPNSVKLKIGDVIHRHIKDGDVCLFNRQPSLHRMSMMGHKARIVENNTFRLNVFVCLSGDTIINTDMGSTTITDFEKHWETRTIKSSNWNANKQVYDCGVERFHKIVPKELGFKSYEIILENGDKIKATQEHPFYTKHCDRVVAKDLKVNDYLIGYEEDLPPIDYKTGVNILSELEVRKVIPSGTKSDRVINYLKKTDLLNIKYSDKRQITFAGLLGHLIGDGTLWWSDKNVHLTFRSAALEDITSIKNDLISLGFDEKIVKIHEKRKCKNRKITQSNGKVLIFDGNGLYTIDIRRRPIAMMFKALGMPNGDRATQEFGIPYWIMNGSAMVKRQFLKGYFGTDCLTPKVDKRTGYRFKTICFKMSKVGGKSPVKFFEEIYSILTEFEISTLPITVESGNVRKNGEHSFSYKGKICSDISNMQRFCQKVGYLYKKEKQDATMYIAEYCKYIQRINPSIEGQHGYVGVQKYNEWLDKYAIEGTGLVWKKISKINEIEMKEAFDITTKDENHNFISNRVLSKNCNPYNADFDGDEMNTFIPESVQTRVEIEELAGVPRQIITPATSTPIISVAQDSMVGSYLMTKSKFATTGEQLFHYMMPIIQLKSNFNFIKAREKETWTGNELYSMILPNISLKNSKVEIKNGDIVEGFMNKATLGGSSKGIIQAIMNQHGTRVCRDFLDNLQRLVVTWMEDVGFSIGFGDMMPKKNIRNDILKVLNEKRIEANELIRKSQMGLFEPYLSNEHKNAKLEMDIGNIASRAANEVEQIVFDNLPEDNNFIISIKSGTKGKEYNLKQVIGTFGQQNIDGRRLAYGLSGRVLPHYTKWDRSLESRGFVFSSYMNGLTPQEFFYISMGSRSDAIDSNIKTAETGYVQRRLIKALEDLTVEYDGTVRDSTGNIVQMSYGRDGYDSIKLEHVPIKIIKRNDAEMETIYQWSVDDISEAVLTEDAYEKLMKEKKENETALLKEWNQLLKDRSDLRYKHFPHLIKEVETVLAPVNMKRLIYQMRNQFQIEENDQSDLTPIEVIELVSDLVDYVSHYNINKGFSPILKILLRSNLSSKQCIFEHRLPGSILTHLIDVIKHKILYAIVNPGEMVGVIAAQSIGEPLTQMTLNTFHFSGLGAKAVLTTSGVPRIQEIINMSKEIKTPSMTIYFKPQYAGNKEIAFEVKNQIEYTEIKDLLLTSEIIYLPDKSKGKFEEEEEQFRVFQEIAELTDTQCPSVDSLSNWVLWMEFDREMMVRKNIYMSDIQEEIVKNCNVDTDIHCVVSNMNSKHLTLRIRVTRSLEEGEGYISFFRHLADCLGTVSLRGIPGIRDVQPDEVKRIDYEPDGTMKSVDEWVLRTNGSNLIAVLSNDYVDVVRTTTNDITEIRSLFGIEGTRNAIIRELNNTIYEGASKVVNNRHYSILADLMTYRGKVMQIQRNGFGKSPYIGPLGRATYEVMDKVLVTAGIFAEEDDMEGTSSNIIAGQGVKAGTNAFDLYINKNLLPTSKQEQNTLFPPEQNVSDRPEANFSPAITPLEAPENFVFDDDFREKMNSSKEVRLEDYIQAISAQTIAADDNDFNFGYGISGMEEHVLPETNIGNIEISIVKSDNNVRNRRRRKR